MALRELIQKNFWLKLLALTLAIVIWIVIRSSQDLSIGNTPMVNPALQETAFVPISVMTHPADGRIFKITPDRVVLTLTGESAVLRKYSRKDYRAYVDLTEFRHKDPSYEETIKVHVPPEVTVLKVVPRGVTIEQISP